MLHAFARYIVGVALATLVVSFPVIAAPLQSVSASADQPASKGNLVVNPGFEQGLAGWNWRLSKAEAQGAIVNGEAHSGQCAFRITNRTPYKWYLYCALEQTVEGLKPDTEYELSAWVKTVNARSCSLGVGKANTAFKEDLPLNSPTWQRVAVRFKTGADETTAPIRIKSNGLTEVLLVDDVAVVAAIDIKRQDLAVRLPDMTKAAAARLVRVRGEAAARGLAGNAYVRLGLNTAARYVARVQQPDIQAKQEDYWTWLQLRETDDVLDAIEGLLHAPLPDVPAIPAGRPAVDRGLFMLGVPTAASPVFYGGYGSKDGDFPDLPRLGVSSTEIEMGPNALAADGSDPGHHVQRLLKRLELASAANIKIMLLLSPHYFPTWALEAAPDVALADKHGFIKFNIDHPIARKAVRQWLRTVTSAVKDHAALLDVCLANEPEYACSGRDPYSKPQWIEYLKQRHGSIDVVNGLYGTTYASFDAVPVPLSRPALSDPVGKRRAYYDWGTFNDRHFADWFHWMNGIVKAAAPRLPTHVKIMAVHALDDNSIGSGIDPEEFCGITDLAGCDNYCYVPDYSEVGGWGDAGASGPAATLYAYGWQTEEITYDLLRSFRNQPVVNSENHFIPDGYRPQVPSDYVRSVMWQGALHGQGATALWVFAEAGKANHWGLDGSIYYRPADVFGVGRAWLDARRCANQIAAVVRAKPHVVILYTRNSLYWEKECVQALSAAYTALTFLGEPVRFVTEKQLAEETAAQVRAIILPQATHVTDATVKALACFVTRGGKLIALGDGNLGRDEYNRRRQLPESLRPVSLPASNDDRVVFRQLAPLARDLGDPAELLDAQTGARIFGVEFRVVSDQGRTYFSALNQLKNALVVKLAGGPQTKIKDLLSGNMIDGTHIRLKPMIPVLLDLGSPSGGK